MKHKKSQIIFLAVLIAVNTALPCFANEVDTIDVTQNDTTAYQVSYSQVEQMVLDRNLQVQSNEITMERLTDDDEIKKQYQKLYDTISQTSSTLTSVIANPSASQDLKTVAMGTTASLSILKTLFESNQDITEDTIDLTELQIAQANDQLVRAAQSMFSVYYQLEYNIKQLKSTRTTLEDSLKSSQKSYQLGMTTLLSVQDTEASLASLKNNITELQNQVILIKHQMNQLLGHAYNARIVFGKMPEPDFAYVQNINLKQDIATAQTNSYTVRIKKLQRSIFSDDVRDEKKQREIKSNEIDAEFEAIGTSVENQFSIIKAQQSALTVEQQKLENAKTKFDQGQKQYQLGLISLSQRNQLEANYISQQTIVNSKKATLFWEIETYRWLLKGLPAS